LLQIPFDLGSVQLFLEAKTFTLAPDREEDEQLIALLFPHRPG